jgi:hypothetical protein
VSLDPSPVNSSFVPNKLFACRLSFAKHFRLERTLPHPKKRVKTKRWVAEPQPSKAFALQARQASASA